MMYQVNLGLKEDEIEPFVESCAATVALPRKRTLTLLAALPVQASGG